METYSVLIRETGETYICRGEETLLAGMVRLGKKGIPVGCCGGGCGICKMKLLSGHYITRPMSRNHISVAEEQTGILLACRVYPRSNVCISLQGKLKRCMSAPGTTAP